MDSETQKLFLEGQRLSDFTKSDAWGYIRDKFNQKLLDLQSINNLSAEKTEDIAREVYARKLAFEYLTDWFKDIEGSAQQHQFNKPLTNDNEYLIEIET